MKSFFGCYGGKQKLASRIVKLIPEHNIYCEPFAGGAAVLVTMGWKPVTNCQHYRAVLNDTNRLIVNFYKVLQTQAFEFFERLAFIPYSERIYHDSKEVCRDSNTEPLDLAVAFFVNITFSYAKKINGGYGKSRCNSNSPFTFNFQKNRLFNLLDLLKKCHVTDTDAVDCIKVWDTENTFFYIDPPYVGTNQGHYSGYTRGELDKLLEILENIKGKFIMSGYDNFAYPDDFFRVEFSTSAGSAAGQNGVGKSKRTEVLLMNFEPEINENQK
jgi:DNA adenine methylase